MPEEMKINSSKMNLMCKAPSTAKFYLKKSQQLLQLIGTATGEAADAVNKFDIQTNSDKICISTVANNFARDLEYTLNNLHRININNHKQGEGNNNLKEVIQAFSTFAFSIQQAFGNDFNKLRVAIINVLQNLGSILDPLLDIGQENSQYTTKSEIASILDYLYIAIEKVKIRTAWEHLDRKGLDQALANVYKAVLVCIYNLKDNQDDVAYYLRLSHECVEAVLQIIEEINVDMDYYDDKIRDMALHLRTKIITEAFDYDEYIRTKKTMSEFKLIANVVALTIQPTIKEISDMLINGNSQDCNGTFKNFILTLLVDLVCYSIRYVKECERITKN